MNSPASAEFYKQVRTTFIKNQMDLSNYRERLKPPALAYIGKSVVDNVRNGDYVGAMSLMAEDLKKEYAVKERAIPKKYPVDPITKKYQPHLKFEVHNIQTEIQARVRMLLNNDLEYQTLLKEDTITSDKKRAEIQKTFKAEVTKEVDAERSDDLLQSIVMANYANQEYIQRKLIETEIALAHHLVKNNLIHTVAEKGSTEFDKAGQKRLQDAVSHYIDVAFYDVRNQSAVSPLVGKPDPDNPNKKVYTSRGLIHGLMTYGRVAILGWSAKLAMLNLGQQAFSNLMKASEGTDFTFPELLRGYRDISKKKNRNLIDRLYIAGDLAFTYNKRTIHEQSKLWSSLHPMKLQSSAEKVNQGATAVAVLHHLKVTDDKGNEISLYDALNEEGDLDEKYRHAEYGDLKGLELLARITTDKIRPVVMKVSGDYISPLLVEQKEWGKLLTMFKKFLPEMLMDRFHAREYDYSLKRETEGRLYALGATISQGVTGRWDQVDKVRMDAARAGLAELAIGMLLRAVFMAMAALSCDTKECREQRPYVLFGLNMIGRLSDDVLELTLPYNLYNNLLNPFAISGTIESFVRFYNDFTAWIIPGGDDGRYKRKSRGHERGDLKFIEKGKSLIPFVRTNIYGINQFSSKLRYDAATYGWIGFSSEIGADQ